MLAGKSAPPSFRSSLAPSLLPSLDDIDHLQHFPCMVHINLFRHRCSLENVDDLSNL